MSLWSHRLSRFMEIVCWTAAGLLLAAGAACISGFSDWRSLPAITILLALLVAFCVGGVVCWPTMKEAAIEADRTYRQPELFVTLIENLDWQWGRADNTQGFLLRQAEAAVLNGPVQDHPYSGDRIQRRWLTISGLAAAGGFMLFAPVSPVSERGAVEQKPGLARRTATGTVAQPLFQELRQSLENSDRDAGTDHRPQSHVSPASRPFGDAFSNRPNNLDGPRARREKATSASGRDEQISGSPTGALATGQSDKGGDRSGRRRITGDAPANDAAGSDAAQLAPGKNARAAVRFEKIFTPIDRKNGDFATRQGNEIAPLSDLPAANQGMIPYDAPTATTSGQYSGLWISPKDRFHVRRYLLKLGQDKNQ